MKISREKRLQPGHPPPQARYQSPHRDKRTLSPVLGLIEGLGALAEQRSQDSSSTHMVLSLKTSSVIEGQRKNMGDRKGTLSGQNMAMIYLTLVWPNPCMGQ